MLVALVQARGAGAHDHRHPVAAITGNGFIDHRLDLRQRRQQKLIIPRAMQGRAIRDGRQLAIDAAQHRILALQPAAAQTHARGHAARQVSGYLIGRVAQGIDQANGRNINHLSHPDIEW